MRTLYLAFGKESAPHITVATSYLCLYLFWLTFFRFDEGHLYFKGGFIWYMLPCVPFMAMIIAHGAGMAWRTATGRIIAGAYLAGMLYFFYLYYPILSGVRLTIAQYENFCSISLYDMLVCVTALNAGLFLAPYGASYFRSSRNRSAQSVS
jgi:dolichyl-phosphate-mannose--protein O-mannosyl transferase